MRLAEENIKKSENKQGPAYLLLSAGLAVLSIAHALLNRLGRMPRTKNKVLFLQDIKRNNIVPQRLIEETDSFVLLNQNMRSAKSFLTRKNCFNSIITRPFLKIGINRRKIVHGYFEYLYSNYLEFLKSNSFKKIVAYDEYSVPSLALVKAGNELGITTIALQHGVIEKDHYGYNFLKTTEDKKMIPRYTLVFSEYEKSFLCKAGSNYSPDSVKPVGFPRYDALKKPEKIFNRRKICRKYGINPNKKIVLWATQSHNPYFIKMNENALNAGLLFPFFNKHRQKYEFIIKLHPDEDQKAPLYTEWNRRLNNFARIINGRENTLELVAVCDLLIIKHSTVGMESILLNTPILLLELAKNRDLSTYLNYGFDLVVRKDEDLEKYVEYIMNGKYAGKFKILRARFIRERFANFGRSTDKMIRLVKRL